MKNKILLVSALTSVSINLNAQTQQQNALTLEDIQKINILLEEKVLVVNENNQLSLAEQLKLEDLVEVLGVEAATNCTSCGSNCW